MGGLRRLGEGRWLLFLEAVVALAMARAAVVMLPFERAMLIAGRRRTDEDVGERQHATRISRVRWAVGAAARRVPWRALCLEQALAARRMLERRSITATIHYGVASSAGKLEAHAWVRAADRDVVGGENAADFIELARFPMDKRSG